MPVDDYENFTIDSHFYDFFIYTSGFKIYTIPIFIFWCCNDCIEVKH